MKYGYYDDAQNNNFKCQLEYIDKSIIPIKKCVKCNEYKCLVKCFEYDEGAPNNTCRECTEEKELRPYWSSHTECNGYFEQRQKEKECQTSFSMPY